MRKLLLCAMLMMFSAFTMAVTVNYDSSKGGPCTWKIEGKNILINCLSSTAPEIGFGSGTRSVATINGVEYVQFVIARAATGDVEFVHNRSILQIDERPVTAVVQANVSQLPSPAPIAAATVPAKGSVVPTVAGMTPQISGVSVPPIVTAAAPATPTTATRAEELAKSIKDLQFDYSIPDMPAFTVLGLTPENVVQPRTSRALVAALKNGVDQNGKLKTGLAIEFAPFRLMDPATVLKSYIQDTLDNRVYSSNSMTQALSNTGISIATAQGTDTDDKSIRLGIGLNVPLIDKSDGRTDAALINCYSVKVDQDWLDNERKIVEAENEVNAAKHAGDKKSEADSLKKRDDLKENGNERAILSAKECYSKRSSARWNATIWTVSLGNAWTSDSGNFSDRKTGTRGAWTTFAYGFDEMPMLQDKAQLIFHLRAVDKERVPNPAATGTFMNQDSRVAGMALKVGSDSFNASLQGSYQRIQIENISNIDKVRKVAFGIEYKLAAGTWLVGTFGGESGRVNGENKSFVNAGLKFDLSKKSLFSPNPAN